MKMRKVIAYGVRVSGPNGIEEFGGTRAEPYASIQYLGGYVRITIGTRVLALSAKLAPKVEEFTREVEVEAEDE